MIILLYIYIDIHMFHLVIFMVGVFARQVQSTSEFAMTHSEQTCVCVCVVCLVKNLENLVGK